MIFLGDVARSSRDQKNDSNYAYCPEEIMAKLLPLVSKKCTCLFPLHSILILKNCISDCSKRFDPIHSNDVWLLLQRKRLQSSLHELHGTLTTHIHAHTHMHTHTATELGSVLTTIISSSPSLQRPDSEESHSPLSLRSIRLL